MYDDGYINMAPSGAAVKPFANGRNGNCELDNSTLTVAILFIVIILFSSTSTSRSQSTLDG